MKKCIECKQLKELSEFYKNKANKNGYTGACKECKRRYRKWYAENKLDKNKNKEYQKEWARKTRKIKPEMYCKISSKWAKNNRDKVNKIAKNWRDNNPEKIAHIKSTRYAREKGAEGSHTLKEWQDLVNWVKGFCVCCCKKKKLTKDHIIPLSLNGSDYIGNIQPLCQSCNASKGNKIICYI